jgi:ribosomal protein S18 acetylase RimI-like enzyme
MSFSIRPCRPADLDELKRITVQAFEAVSIERNIENHFGIIHGHDWRWRKARHIDQDVQKFPEGAFVAEHDGAIVGYITTWIDQESGVGFIPNLAVDAKARGLGIGRALIDHALHFFHAAGIRHARIETLEQNPIGQNLYPSAGFREVARQIHYCLELPEVIEEGWPQMKHRSNTDEKQKPPE